MADADEQFSLQWNNHQTVLVNAFESLFRSSVLTDCTLAAEGNQINAHKMVLSACSPYFAKLLSQNFDKHPIFILKDIQFNDLKAIMDYMYKGVANIYESQLPTLLKAAELLQVKGLSDKANQADAPSNQVDSKINCKPNENLKLWLNTQTARKRTHLESEVNYDTADSSETQVPQSVTPTKSNIKTEKLSTTDDNEFTRIGPIHNLNEVEVLSNFLDYEEHLRSQSHSRTNTPESQGSEFNPSQPNFNDRRRRRQRTKVNWNIRGKYRCKNCQKQYAFKSGLYRHTRTECGLEGPYDCPFCEHKGKMKSSMEKHVLLKHKDVIPGATIAEKEQFVNGMIVKIE